MVWVDYFHSDGFTDLQNNSRKTAVKISVIKRSLSGHSLRVCRKDRNFIVNFELDMDILKICLGG